MSKDYVIGVDGGQTSTKCVLARADGLVLAEGAGPGMVHLSAQNGEAIFRIGAAISDCISLASRRPAAATTSRRRPWTHRRGDRHA